jgi:hypothetical protein
MTSSRSIQVILTSCVVLKSLTSVTSFSTTKTGLSDPPGILRNNGCTERFTWPTTLPTVPFRTNNKLRGINHKLRRLPRHVGFMTTDAALPSDAADDDSFTAPASTDSSSNTSGATVTELIFNLIKGIVGAGVLSLPAGIAAWGSAPSAVIPAVALIAIIGALSGYGFALIGRCCAYTNTNSYRDAWSATVSESSSWLPATAVTFKTICAILAYSMILGDTFVGLLSTLGFAATKVPVTIGLSSTVLLPLCLMKNLSSLAPFSLLGSLGMIYTALAMTIRYLGKAYTANGKFGMDLAASLRPKFGEVGASGILTPSAAILVGMLSTAYMVRNIEKVQFCRLVVCHLTDTLHCSPLLYFPSFHRLTLTLPR